MKYQLSNLFIESYFLLKDKSVYSVKAFFVEIIALHFVRQTFLDFVDRKSGPNEMKKTQAKGIDQ
jgi:hypothetical protein